MRPTGSNLSIVLQVQNQNQVYHAQQRGRGHAIIGTSCEELSIGLVATDNGASGAVPGKSVRRLISIYEAEQKT